MTVEIKFKLATKSTGPSSKRFAITPKNIEIANLKVMRGAEELEMEQMLI